jgi:4-aminobutyrate aminotransferase-like enzyme
VKPNAIRLMPPLIAQSADIDSALDILRVSLKQVMEKS